MPLSFPPKKTTALPEEVDRFFLIAAGYEWLQAVTLPLKPQTLSPL